MVGAIGTIRRTRRTRKKKRKTIIMLFVVLQISQCRYDVTLELISKNVLIQMGLRILSIEGLRIKTARLWTYRCRCCNEYVPFIRIPFD